MIVTLMRSFHRRFQRLPAASSDGVPLSPHTPLPPVGAGKLPSVGGMGMGEERLSGWPISRLAFAFPAASASSSSGCGVGIIIIASAALPPSSRSATGPVTMAECRAAAARHISRCKVCGDDEAAPWVDPHQNALRRSLRHPNSASGSRGRPGRFERTEGRQDAQRAGRGRRRRGGVVRNSTDSSRRDGGSAVAGCGAAAAPVAC